MKGIANISAHIRIEKSLNPQIEYQNNGIDTHNAFPAAHRRIPKSLNPQIEYPNNCIEHHKPLTGVVFDFTISGFGDAVVSGASRKDYRRIEKSLNPQIENQNKTIENQSNTIEDHHKTIGNLIRPLTP